MKKPPVFVAKITKPKTTNIFARKRLFRIFNAARDKPLLWISGPGGSGKTTLAGSYLDDRKIPSLWYQMDEGDADPASFFYYLGLAARSARIKSADTLPLLTSEYTSIAQTFGRRYFESLCRKLRPPFILVFDNYQTVPRESLRSNSIAAAIMNL